MDDGRISLLRGVEFFPACHERRVSECKAWNFRIDLVGRFGDDGVLRSEPRHCIGAVVQSSWVILNFVVKLQ